MWGDSRETGGLGASMLTWLIGELDVGARKENEVWVLVSWPPQLGGWQCHLMG